MHLFKAESETHKVRLLRKPSSIEVQAVQKLHPGHQGLDLQVHLRDTRLVLTKSPIKDCRKTGKSFSNWAWFQQFTFKHLALAFQNIPLIRLGKDNMEIQQAFCQIWYTTFSLRLRSLFTQEKVAPSGHLTLLLKLVALFLLLYYSVKRKLCVFFIPMQNLFSFWMYLSFSR